MKKTDFLHQLQTQAELQSSIEQSSVLPHSLDRVNTWIGNHAWQFLLLASGVSALILNILHWIQR
jgi:hypothetical protein